MRRRPGIAGLQRGAQTRVRTARAATAAQLSTALRISWSKLLHPPRLLNRCVVSSRDVRMAVQDQYKALGEHVHAVQAEVMAEQLATFKRSLEEFAIKHR